MIFRRLQQGWGKTVVLGVDKPNSKLSLSSHDVLHNGKILTGSLFGGLKAKSDISTLVNWYLDKVILHSTPQKYDQDVIKLAHFNHSAKIISNNGYKTGQYSYMITALTYYEILKQHFWTMVLIDSKAKRYMTC